MDIKNSIVSIWDQKERIVGTAFIVDTNLLLTCAHLVEQATAGDNKQVRIRFGVDGSAAIARVKLWNPPYENDVALLSVDLLPPRATPLPLAFAGASSAHEYYTYGYATVLNVQGIGARGTIIDIVDNGRLIQLRSQELDHGMSGAPVFDEQLQVVIGMISKGAASVSMDGNSRNSQIAFATSINLIHDLYPKLPIVSVNKNTSDDQTQSDPIFSEDSTDELEKAEKPDEESKPAKKPSRKAAPRKSKTNLPAPTPEIPTQQVSKLHNGLEICVAGTAKGWLLPTEGVVIRDVMGTGMPGGAFYRGMLNNLEPAFRTELSDLFKKELLTATISTSDPLVVRVGGELGKQLLPFMPGTVAHVLVLLTIPNSSDKTDEVRSLINGVVRAAQRYKLTSLVMPVLSPGGIGSDEETVSQARQMLNALLATQDFGPLKKLTIATILPAVVDMARQRFNVYSNNQAQPFSNDEPGGVDLLNISAETDALADTLLLREVHAPLAVGITGGWGSGKSFVMHLLQQRMTHIRTRSVSQGWAEAGGTFPFVGHIYQIRFNAWTYAKANLWASLMHTIFFELNRQISLEKVFSRNDRETMLAGGEIFKNIYNPDYRVNEDEFGLEASKILDDNLLWKVMRQQKQPELEALHELEAKIAAAKAKREELNKQQLEAVQKDLAKQAQLSASGVLKQKIKALLGQTIDQEVRSLLKKADLNDGQVEELLNSLRSVRATWNILWETATKSGRNLALTLLLVIFVAGSFVVTPLLAEIFKWDAVARLTTQLGVIVLALLPIIRVAGNWSRRINEIVSEYQSAVETEKRNGQATREARIAEKQAEDEKELSEKLKDTTLGINEKLTLLENLAKTNLAARDRLIEILQASAEDQRKKIGPTARYLTLLEFVRSRLNEAGYETQLGLLQQVYEDFEELTASLMRPDQRIKEMFPRGEPRVVLFIDDLDRCPPSRVVEVLEAVQLLLKTELFVVILGLDTRYVTRALEKEYKEILQHEGDPSGLDYIEKIIQIPYRVRPMEPAGLQNYLKAQMAIAIPTPDETPTPAEPEKPKSGRKSKTAIEPASQVIPTIPPNQTEVPSALVTPTLPIERPVELPPEVIKFQLEDLEDLTFCCQQVDLTPRSVKRLVNVFKLIKIFWFRGLGGDQQRPVKQAVMSLLALSAAYPEMMRESFVRMEMGFRDAQRGQTIIFDELAKLNPDQTTEKTLSLKLNLFQRDVAAFKAKDFGNISLSALELGTFNLIRSFSFVGDPSYWVDKKIQSVE